VVLLVANRHGEPSAADFGLRRPPHIRAVGLLLAGWIGFIVAIVLWASALGLDGEDAQALTDRLGTDGTLIIVILIVVPYHWTESLYPGIALHAPNNSSVPEPRCTGPGRSRS